MPKMKNKLAVIAATGLLLAPNVLSLTTVHAEDKATQVADTPTKTQHFLENQVLVNGKTIAKERWIKKGDVVTWIHYVQTGNSGVLDYIEDELQEGLSFSAENQKDFKISVVNSAGEIVIKDVTAEGKIEFSTQGWKWTPEQPEKWFDLTSQGLWLMITTTSTADEDLKSGDYKNLIRLSTSNPKNPKQPPKHTTDEAKVRVPVEPPKSKPQNPNIPDTFDNKKPDLTIFINTAGKPTLFLKAIGAALLLGVVGLVGYVKRETIGKLVAKFRK